MKRTLVVAILCFAAAAAVARPDDVDPTLAIAASDRASRLLVYARCSPEHCWSETELQIIGGSASEPRTECAVSLQEVATGHIVQSVRVAPTGGFELDLAPSHGGFEPYTARVVPLGGCRYEFRSDLAGS